MHLWKSGRRFPPSSLTSTCFGPRNPIEQPNFRSSRLPRSRIFLAMLVMLDGSSSGRVRAHRVLRRIDTAPSPGTDAASPLTTFLAPKPRGRALLGGLSTFFVDLAPTRYTPGSIRCARRQTYLGFEAGRPIQSFVANRILLITLLLERTWLSISFIIY